MKEFKVTQAVVVGIAAASVFAIACSDSGTSSSSSTSSSTSSSGGSSSGSSSSSSGSSSSSSSSSGSPADNCSSFAGAYNVTTEIVTTDCPLGLHVVTKPVVWTFVQTAPSCSFTMTNSVYDSPLSHYSGYFTMDGANAKVTWTTVDPAPVAAGRTLTYTSESLVITAPVAPATLGNISGSFAWSTSKPCTGTTNVCHGTVADCLTPQ